MKTVSLRPGSGQIHSSEVGDPQARIDDEFREATSRLIATLQHRLAGLRATGDPEVSALAMSCERELGQICEHIGKLSRPSDSDPDDP